MSAISTSRDDDFLPEMPPSTGLVVEETYGDWLPPGREPDIMKGGVVDLEKFVLSDKVYKYHPERISIVFPNLFCMKLINPCYKIGTTMC